MRFYQLRNWILKNIDVKTRLHPVCLWFLLSIMVETRKQLIDRMHQSFQEQNKAQLLQIFKEQ
jgi:hypothetical protein